MTRTLTDEQLDAMDERTARGSQPSFDDAAALIAEVYRLRAAEQRVREERDALAQSKSIDMRYAAHCIDLALDGTA